LNFLLYLESTIFSEWVLTSMLGFPTLIAFHSIGMAVAAGLSIIIAFYLNGYLAGISQHNIPRLLRLAGLGFFLNLATGVAIFIPRGTDYITSATFLIKMLLVLISAGILFWLKNRLSELDQSSLEICDDKLSRRLSLLCAISWIGAIVAGRLIAYLSDLY
jgi:hypothetical protein